MRVVRLVRILAFAAVLGVAPAALRAQAHGDSAKPAAAAAPAHAADPHATPAAGHDTGGHGAGAHHGPSVRLPFMHRDLTPNEQYLLKLFNFVVFALLLVLPLKGALAAAFKARAQELEERLTLAEKEKAEGEAQVRELEARMAGLEGELDGILSKADADAQTEKERVLAAARVEAEAILAQARSEIEFQRKLAEQELRALVAELAVEGASTRLQARLEGPASAVMVDRAIEQIGARASEGVQ